MEIIKAALGNAFIDLDNQTLSYLEHTLDDVHIIDVEFDGVDVYKRQFHKPAQKRAEDQ